MSKTIHGITPGAPGWIDALLAHHRRTFGDAVMQDPASTPAGAPAGTDQPPAGTGAPAATQPPVAAQPPAASQPPAAPEWDGKIETLPAPVQKMIADLRTEAGDERIAKKTLDAIQKALNPDAPEGAKPDAAALTQQLTDAAAEAKQAKTELAVWQAATRLGADAELILDSRGLMAKLSGIDPTVTADIDKVITEAVTANPKLKAARAAGTSGADFSGGSGEKQRTAAEQAAPGVSRIAASFNTPT